MKLTLKKRLEVIDLIIKILAKKKNAKTMCLLIKEI